MAVDPEIKNSNLKRLRRIEGQVRGLPKMMEEERYCADIVIQIASVQEALRGVSRALMQNHLRHCATETIRTGDEKQAAAQYEELLELITGICGNDSRPPWKGGEDRWKKIPFRNASRPEESGWAERISWSNLRFLLRRLQEEI